MNVYLLCLEEDIEGEIDDNYVYRRTEAREGHRKKIDTHTIYFKLFDITNECLMHEFGMKQIPDYQHEDGYGYYKSSGDDSKSITAHKKVILMDEVCKQS